jgi:hypothetical protein
LATAWWPARENHSIAAAFGRLVSNMIAGPLTPRDSRLIAKPTWRASGSRSRKARAPSRPSSSPSSKRKMIGRPSRMLRAASAISSIVATPMPSSAAPGPAKVLS